MAKEIKQKKLSNDILIFQLQERYHSMHIMRERIQTLSLRIMGIFLGVSGWLAQNKLNFDCCEKATVILLACIVFIFFFIYFENLKKGFIEQLNIANRLEAELGLYKGNYPILKEFKENKNRGNRISLNYHYTFLCFGFIVLLICILHFI